MCPGAQRAWWGGGVWKGACWSSNPHTASDIILSVRSGSTTSPGKFTKTNRMRLKELSVTTLDYISRAGGQRYVFPVGEGSSCGVKTLWRALPPKQDDLSRKLLCTTVRCLQSCRPQWAVSEEHWMCPQFAKGGNVRYLQLRGITGCVIETKEMRSGEALHSMWSAITVFILSKNDWILT